MKVKSILVTGYIKDQNHLRNMIDYCDRQSPIFDASGKEKNPAEVKAEITAQESGIVWNSVFSLSEQDCKRLGVNRDYMKDLIAAKAAQIAEIYNIRPDHFRAACSFHEKDFHPHLHFLFWSTEKGEGFIPHPGDKPDPNLNKATRQLKSLLTNEIFAGDTLYLKKEKMERREQLNKQLQSALRSPVNEEISAAVGELGEKLSEVRGKHTYKYLPADLKKEVDGLLEKICKSEPAVGRAAKAYLDTQRDMHLVYASDEDVLEKHFAEIEKNFFHPDYQKSSARAEVTRHNIIIKAADELYQLGTRDKAPENLEEEFLIDLPELDPGKSLPDPDPDEIWASSKERKTGGGWELYREGKKLVEEDPSKAMVCFQAALQGGVSWAGYQLGKMYSNEGSELYDLARAVKNYTAAAEDGNTIASYQLGGICEKEGTDYYDLEEAIGFYQRAVNDELVGDRALIKLGQIFTAREKYREALTYFSAAAKKGNLWAKYIVANYHAQGRGCQKDLKVADNLLRYLRADLEDKIQEAQEKKLKPEDFDILLKDRVQETLDRLSCMQGKELLKEGNTARAYDKFSESNSLSARYYKARMEISGKGGLRNVAQGRQTLAEIAQHTPDNEYEEVIVEAAKNYFNYVEKSKSACVRKMVFQLLNNLQQTGRGSPQQYKEKNQGFKGRKQKIRVVHRGIGKETNVGIDD